MRASAAGDRPPPGGYAGGPRAPQRRQVRYEQWDILLTGIIRLMLALAIILGLLLALWIT